MPYEMIFINDMPSFDPDEPIPFILTNQEEIHRG